MVFGRSTGSQGLDQLLMAGYYVPESEKADFGIAMAVSGPPGVGKSALVMAHAVAAAARGATSYVFENERPTEILKRNIRTHYGLLSDYVRLSELKRGDILNETHTPERGTLYITGHFGGGAALSLSDLATSFSEIAQRKTPGQEILLVIDSASSYRQGIQDFEWRQELNFLTTLLTEAGVSVLLVLEQNKEEFREEDYVVDLAIHLTSTTDPSIAYAQRNLEIVKSRYQFSNRGLHFYSVRPGRGAVVYPSSAASITMRRRSEVNRPRIQRDAIKLAVAGFAACASRKNPPFPPEGDPISWWHDGSLTLLTGPRGSYKQAFAQAFASVSSFEDGGTEDIVLAVHFGHELPQGSFSGNDIENEVVPSSVGQHYCVRRPGHLPVHLYLFRTSYFAPGPVMDEISRFLDSTQARGKVRRAVVSDLAVLAAHFPFLQQDPLFIPTLCDLLTSFGVTTCLVYTPQDGPTPDRAYQLLTTFVENEIEFSGPRGGRYQLQVRSSADNSHYAGALDIESVTATDGVDEAAPGGLLVGWSRTLTSRDQKIPVQVFLDSGTELQKKHNKMLKRAVAPALKVRSLNLGLLYDRRNPLVVSGLDSGTLKIAAIDSFLVRWLAGEDGKLRTPLLEPIWAPPNKLSRLLEELSYSGALESHETLSSLPRDLREGRACLFSIPYFLNPSLLVLDAEFADFCETSHSSLVAVDGGIGHPREEKGSGSDSAVRFSTWESLIASLRSFPKAKGNPNLRFSFRRETDETINCLFFEILASQEGGFEVLHRFAAALGSSRELAEQDLDLVLRSLGILKQLWDLGASEADQKKREDCVAWREWYSTYRELESNIRTSGRAVRIAQLPSGVWTSGDWHLAVLRGSAFANVGLNIIEDHFVERGNSMSLMVEGVGLPPFKSFYLKQGRLPVSGVSPSWYAGYVRGERVIYRSRLTNYIRYAKILSFHLKSMVESACLLDGSEVEKRQREHFAQRIQQLFQIVQTSRIRET